MDSPPTYAKKFTDADYLGIEIEIRNSLRPASATWQKLAATLARLAVDFRAVDH